MVRFRLRSPPILKRIRCIDKMREALLKVDSSWRKVLRCAESALDKKAYDLVVLDVELLTTVSSYFIICTGKSDIQVRTICRAVEDGLRGDGHRPLALEGVSNGQWVLMDYGDFLVHVFDSRERDYYQLERLWSDRPLASFPPSEA